MEVVIYMHQGKVALPTKHRNAASRAVIVASVVVLRVMTEEIDDAAISTDFEASSLKARI